MYVIISCFRAMQNLFKRKLLYAICAYTAKLKFLITCVVRSNSCENNHFSILLYFTVALLRFFVYISLIEFLL